MLVQYIKSPAEIKELEQYQSVEMDSGINRIQPNTSGFKSYGVSSCIVLVGYYKQKLIFMMHESIPDSRDSKQVSDEFIDALFRQVLNKYKYLNLKELEIYAMGGQESSIHTVDAIRDFAKKKLPFTLDTQYLHLVHDEDYFDLYVSMAQKKFLVIHHRVEVNNVIKDKININESVAPLLYNLAIVAKNEKAKLKSAQSSKLDNYDSAPESVAGLKL